MKLAAFNDLCRREYADREGIVTKLTLGPDSYAELCADVLGDAVVIPAALDGVACGAALTQLVNPATEGGPRHPMPVQVSLISPEGFDFTGTAEVTRWVPVGAEMASPSDLH